MQKDGGRELLLLAVSVFSLLDDKTTILKYLTDNTTHSCPDARELGSYCRRPL